MSTFNRRLLYTSITLSIWILSVFVCEAMYRIYGVSLTKSMEGFYDNFGNNGFKHRSNAAVTMNWYSGVFHVYTDNLGFRVRDKSGQDGERLPKVDILVLGDSQAFGQGLDYGDTVIGSFAEKAATADLQVSNAAIGGHFLSNQVELSRWLIEKKGIRPKIILMCVSPRMLAFPETYSEAHVRNGVLFDRKPSTVQLVRKWLASNSTVYIVARNAYRSIKGDTETSATVLNLYLSGNIQKQRKEAFVNQVTELRRLFWQNSPVFVICYLPLEVEERVEMLAEQMGAGWETVRGRAPAETSEAIAATLGAVSIDLSKIMAQVRQEGEPITLRGDPHYGKNLSHKCGESIWNSLDWRTMVKTGVD